MNTSAPARPVLRQTPTGWLALSAPDEYLRFAVVAKTEEAAEQAYYTSYEQWHQFSAGESDPVNGAATP